MKYEKSKVFCKRNYLDKKQSKITFIKYELYECKYMVFFNHDGSEFYISEVLYNINENFSETFSEKEFKKYFLTLDQYRTNKINEILGEWLG